MRGVQFVRKFAGEARHCRAPSIGNASQKIFRFCLGNFRRARAVRRAGPGRCELTCGEGGRPAATGRGARARPPAPRRARLRLRYTTYDNWVIADGILIPLSS
ncbi:hypothetical protein EVAR_39809_1 [Eumeta japonica]|uniref:Uncharacterized protein n=1 Tax=Eumeta variegata TaxID=151549 RepID=A0A4C1XB71_EUMVA|nr:hypothetical protein EVAR_39809_1 [Eumeta japonica]